MAKQPEVYPLSKIKKGQKGYGVTVLRGTELERFEFEVIGVLKNAMPKQDLILVRSDDPKLQLTGFAQGMSGSPLYIEGKVACAFSYAWRFNKEAMGACTPIENMISEARTPLRGAPQTIMASTEEWQRYRPLDGVVASPDAPRPSWFAASPLPPVPAQSKEQGLVRAGIPLSVAGLGPLAFEQTRSIFAPYGLEAQQAGGTGSPDGGATRFEMGGSIAVIMARGDVSMAGTGTVSLIDDQKVLAFGHPMFQMGEVYMPVAGADVHYVVASAQTAFKLASPTRVLGSLTQDRQSMIAIDTSQRVDMIPVELTVKARGQEHKFRSEVARNRFLTAQLVLAVVVNGAQLLFPDVADAVVTMDSTLFIRGMKPLAFKDYLYSNDGAANAVAAARALRVLGPLLFNPWSPVVLDKIEVGINVEYKADFANIVDARLPANTVPYGKKTEIELVLEPFQGARYVERVPITFPESLAGQVVKLEIVPGDFARLDVAQPENLPQLVDALRKSYPANVLVVSVATADEGVTLGGKIVARLPDSAIDSARPAASMKGGDPYRSLFRVAVPMKRVIQGKAELTVQVEEKRR
jgi:hypothetical protein